MVANRANSPRRWMAAAPSRTVTGLGEAVGAADRNGLALVPASCPCRGGAARFFRLLPERQRC